MKQFKNDVEKYYSDPEKYKEEIKFLDDFCKKNTKEQERNYNENYLGEQD